MLPMLPHTLITYKLPVSFAKHVQLVFGVLAAVEGGVVGGGGRGVDVGADGTNL